MILDREEMFLSQTEPFCCSIVQVEMGEFSYLFKRIDVHSETMVLAGDLYGPTLKIFHWMIASVMPEFKLVGLPS